MALFTDAAVITLADLEAYESSLSQVASAHGIDVDSKVSLATNAVGDSILVWLLNAGASDPQWLTRRVIGLSTLVVTAPLKRWMIFESLSRFFAEAYNVQLNTRFQGKWTEYQSESQKAANVFFSAGAGVVYSPLPKPTMPLLSIQSGAAPEQAIFVQTSWVDGSGNESALSVSNGTVLPDNSSFAVAMAEGALNAPPPAVGWNLYSGNQPSALTLQNSYPLSVGSTWQLPSAGLQVGAQPTEGQRPAFYITLSKQIRRG